jgi:alpha-L-arabinofuranosidase
MMVRNAARVPVANATALLHGGCIRKAGGSYYTDLQYPALQQFTRMAGGYPLAIRLETPGFDVTTACDLGAPLRDVPFVDVSAVLLLPPGRPPSLRVALTNCHLERPAVVRLVVSGGAPAGAARLAFMAGGDYTLRATPADPQPVQVVERDLDASDGGFDLTLPPLSVSWLTVPIELDHS